MSRTNLILGTLLILALGLRLAWALTRPIFPSDTKQYILLAENLAVGHGFSLSTQAPYYPTDFRPPLYPAVLSIPGGIFGYSNLMVLLLHEGLAAATLLFLFLLGCALYDARAGIVTAGLYAFNLPGIVYTALPLTEILYGFFIVMGTWFTLRLRSRRQAVVCGIVLGLAALTRSEALVYVFVLALLLVVAAVKTKQDAVRGGLLLLAALVTVAPWVARNELTFGQAEIADTNIVWRNLLMGTLPSIRELEAHYPYQHADGGVLDASEHALQRAQIWEAVTTEIQAAPLAYIAYRVRQLAGLVIYDGDFFYQADYPLGRAVANMDVGYLLLRAAVWLLWGFLPIVLAIVGFKLARDGRVYLLLVLPALVLLPSIFIFTEYRLGFAAHTLLLVPAGAAGVWVWERTRRLHENIVAE